MRYERVVGVEVELGLIQKDYKCTQAYETNASTYVVTLAINVGHQSPC